MNLWQRIKQAFAFRSHPRSPSRWLMELFGGAESAAGIRVNAENALQVSAVYACVRVISETLATLPVGIFEHTADGGNKPAPGHPAWALLKGMPNPEMTPLEFKEMLTAHTALRGNSFAQIIHDGAMRPRQLWPLHPDRVSIRRDGGELFYEYRPTQGATQVFPASEILHLRGLMSDGVWGMNPIAVARETFGAAIATQGYGARFFANDAAPGGVLEHPNSLSDKAHDNLRKSWEDNHKGFLNGRRPAILEEGMKWTTLSIKPEEAQFLETRKFQVQDIARIFRVPPHLIQDLERSTFSNVEQQSIDFVTHTMLGWVSRWEQALSAKLLTEAERERFFFKFNLNALLRGDVAARFTAYAVGRQWGWLSANDVRRLEDLNPLPSEVGDVYLSPLNMIPAEDAGKAQDEGGDDAQRALNMDNMRRYVVQSRPFLVKNGAAKELLTNEKEK